MARLVSLAELKSESRFRSNMERSGFIQDPELTSYINASLTELYDLLVDAYGSDYYLADPYVITTVSGQESYALPPDFYKLMGIDQDNGDGNIVTLKPFMFSERNQYQGPYFSLQSFAPLSMYQIRGDKISFIPKDNQANTYKVWYIPACPKLVADGDTFDGVNGWEEYVIVDCAIKMRVKEESDVQVLLKSKQDMYLRLKAMAKDRDSGMSLRVTDVQRGDASPYVTGIWGAYEF